MKKKVKIKEFITSNKGTTILYIVLMLGFTLFLLDGIFEFCLDTAVQVKAGQWMIENKSLITGDIFSWHEGLNWVPHEQLWYLAVGVVYNLSGIIGLSIFGFIFNALIFTFLIKTSTFDKDYKPTGLAILITLIVTANLSIFFPSRAVRPQLFSTLALAILIYYLSKDSKKALKIFPIITWLTALIHGGILKVFFILMALWLVVEIVYDRQLKTTLKKALWVVLGFGTSLLTPNFLDTWTYAKKQEMYPEIRSMIAEWGSSTMYTDLLFCILITTIGIVLDKRWKKKEETFIFQSLAFFMFTMSTVIYLRMQLYCLMFMLILMPKAIENIVEYVIGFLWGKPKYIVLKVANAIENKKKYIYTFINIVLLILIPINFFNSTKRVSGNTINDAASVCGYNTEVIDFIKEQGYEKIYNSYNSGQWLLFNGLKVHIDNRLDPYLKSYSGEDNIHNSFSITNISHLDDFYENYHPDALVINYETQGEEKDNTTKSGEIYPHSNYMTNFIEEVDKYRSDRYEKVYDKAFKQGDSEVNVRWVIYECKE